MADSHLQVNHDGSTGTRRTSLWPTSKPEQEVVIKSIFEQNYWAVSSITNISGSHWKVIVACPAKELKINLYISSIRDESRQPDEFKMQLGNTYPSGIEEGWLNLVLGIYVINEEGFPVEYILSGYEISRYDFSTNPSIRGTRTAGLQRAKLFGMYQTEKSVLFRPEFLYYYIESQQNQDFIDSPEQCPDVATPRQIIFYGAPGTGKSNRIEEATNDDNRIRTTFHPDSDYSTFVGAYKPTMEETGVSHGDKKEKKISYNFVPQAFLKAYVEAWKRMDKGNESPYYLVIEEINRGNCAQIFGDLFQLLDRNDEGESRYAIAPDDDIKRHLEKELANCTNIPEKIMKGEEMRLPSNLYIWATMNTSDQSLFPIDSAFKRRWDWEYMPIENGNKNFVIDIAGTQYDWWDFISTINAKIDRITGSEDKKLGYWFAKPSAGKTSIDCQLFVSKVLFYLWNDVYKDYADSKDSIFRADNNGQSIKTPFTTFFGSGREERVKAFMAFNGIQPVQLENENDNSDIT